MTDTTGQSLEQRFASLEEASRTLSLDVQGLNEALRIVAHLSTEQAAQRRRQDEADRALTLAKEEADRRERRRRRTFSGASLALAVLIPLASIFVYSSLIGHVNDLLDEQRAGFFRSCQLRNQATLDNIARERALADVAPDSKVARIHAASAQSLEKSMVDCAQYLR